MEKGRVTIPTDANFVEGTKQIAKLWGADAVRDCDGVSLPKNANKLAKYVYNTYFVVRGDNAWGRKHPEEAQRIFLESNRIIADGKQLIIDVSKGFLKEEIAPDFDNINRWQVFDRTTNEEIKSWHLKDNLVVIDSLPFHEYSVDFLARVTWHPVQIYNYLTNSWTCEKQLCYDPAYPHTKEYIKSYLRKWLEEHKETNVVRFTTFLYQFNLIFNDKGKERMVDWFGYGEAASIPLLDGFEKETHLKMEAEDFISNGSYNSPFKMPTEKYKKYIDYVQRFVSSTMKELIDIVHSYKKEAMMFLGDDWIGSEPYGPYFKNMGLDSVVGSVGGGVTVRMLGEIPHVKIHEGRFLPYFFPDTFFEGNEDNAVAELEKNWVTARRALLRCPLDRMGFGGYLSLASKFPKFVNRVASICDEFRLICDTSSKSRPYSSLKVGILNCWGKLRSWQAHMVAHELWYQQIYSYQGVYEALSGLPVDVSFLSFDDILNNDIPSDIDVILNVGEERSAFTGDKYWKNPVLVEKIRKFVSNGHGFVGIGMPSSTDSLEHCFALSDVLGVQVEKGLTLSIDKYNIEKKSSFITKDCTDQIDYGEGCKNIYALDNAAVLDIDFSSRFKRNVNVGEVKLAYNDYFKGRGVYLAGLPYSNQNARLLYRSLLYACHKEDKLNMAFSSNYNVEVAYYPSLGMYALINNSNKVQETFFFNFSGESKKIKLEPNQMLWEK